MDRLDACFKLATYISDQKGFDCVLDEVRLVSYKQAGRIKMPAKGGEENSFPHYDIVSSLDNIDTILKHSLEECDYMGIAICLACYVASGAEQVEHLLQAIAKGVDWREKSSDTRVIRDKGILLDLLTQLYRELSLQLPLQLRIENTVEQNFFGNKPDAPDKRKSADDSGLTQSARLR